MLRIRLRRFAQVFQFGWKDAQEISQLEGGGRFCIFIDILRCFMKYYVSGYQYKNNHLWKVSNDDKAKICVKLGQENVFKDEWLNKYYKNWQFLNKYSGIKWETTQRRRTRRNKAYAEFYGFGDNCWTQYNAFFLFEHYSIGSFRTGKNCMFARGCNIDYTGDLTIKDSVLLSEGVKILTHEHELDFIQRDSLRHGLIKTPLIIHDNVGIGAHAIIMPGVTEIGRGAMISAGAVVRKRVPPYAVVMGNPSRVVGFRYTPDQIIELEEELYPAEKRIPEEELKRNYELYYLNRIQEIKAFLGQ